MPIKLTTNKKNPEKKQNYPGRSTNDDFLQSTYFFPVYNNVQTASFLHNNSNRFK